MAERKRSVTFSLSDRNIAMIEELTLELGESRSELLRAWILRAWNARYAGRLGPAHTSPKSGRIWGPDGNKCNPKMMSGKCLICYPMNTTFLGAKE